MAACPMMLLSLGCALLPLCRGTLNDALASVQTVIQTHEGEPGLISQFMNALASAATEAVAGEKDLNLAASMSDSAEHGTTLGLRPDEANPSTQYKPIVHGVYMERKFVSIEPGARAEVQVDHGCQTFDENGGNICQYPYGSKVHVVVRYRVPKPIDQGFLFYSAQVQAQGVAGLMQNIRVGNKRGLVAHLKPVQVECVLCGGDCQVDILGAVRTIKMPACPIPAEQDITIFDEDVQFPGGSFLALLKGRVDGTLSIKRMEDMEEQTVFEVQSTTKTGRLELPLE